jgi:WD40 repeat protein
MLTQNVCASDAHSSVKFNPSNQAELASCGDKSVCFWTWKEFSLDCYKGKLLKKDLGHFAGSFTGTIFLPDTSSCLTATSEGYVIVWGTQYAASISRAQGAEPMKMAVKVRIIACPSGCIVARSLISACTSVGDPPCRVRNQPHNYCKPICGCGLH